MNNIRIISPAIMIFLIVSFFPTIVIANENNKSFEFVIVVKIPETYYTLIKKKVWGDDVENANANALSFCVDGLGDSLTKKPVTVKKEQQEGQNIRWVVVRKHYTVSNQKPQRAPYKRKNHKKTILTPVFIKPLEDLNFTFDIYFLATESFDRVRYLVLNRKLQYSHGGLCDPYPVIETDDGFELPEGLLESSEASRRKRDDFFQVHSLCGNDEGKVARIQAAKEKCPHISIAELVTLDALTEEINGLFRRLADHF